MCTEKLSVEQRHQLDALFEAFSIIGEGHYVYLCDMKTDISRWSKEAVTVFDLPGEYMENAGEIWSNYIHPADKDAYRQSITDIFTQKATNHDMQYRALKRDGEYTICECKGVVIRSPDGSPAYFAGLIVDRGVVHDWDELTGLPNQYAFLEYISSLIANEQPASMIMFGISEFSAINELHGYSWGNRILQHLSHHLRKCLKNSGKIFRLDGCKFIYISETEDIKQLEERYLHLQRTLKGHFFVDGVRQNLVTNGGAMVLNSFQVTPRIVYSCLHYAYRVSKREMHGNYYVFQNDMQTKERNRLEMLNDIRDSIIDGCAGFYLCYQPIVDAETEQIIGLESLIRYQDKKWGIVSPNDFIPVLEEDALFPELGEWILRTALAESAPILKACPGIVLNVNLSYAQIESPGFLASVKAAINETGFPSDQLCLEITERCRLLDLKFLEHRVRNLKQMGISIALDDFGTGFSSLTVLKEIPIDIVKVDREIIKEAPNDETAIPTVETVVKLASVYHSKVCVEGVETTELRDELRKTGARSFQGFLYSKPVRPEEIIDKFGTRSAAG